MKKKKEEREEEESKIACEITNLILLMKNDNLRVSWNLL